MSKKVTGGPAFPFYRPGFNTETVIEKFAEGLTLRDYFAAKAMAGFCANRTEEQLEIPADQCHAIVAKHAYKMADAMIAERSKP